jgi:competence protein ComK
MEIKSKYLIKQKTVVLKGIYNNNGEQFTDVVEGEDRFLVSKSPMQIIEDSLISYGSDFNGALKSSKKLLGERVKLNPIMVSSTLDIWMFPSKCHKKQNCIWFVLNHIEGTESLGRGFTKIYLSYDHTFEIRMREISFKNKRDNAKELRDKITKNTNNPTCSTEAPRKGYCLVEDKGTYTVIKK